MVQVTQIVPGVYHIEHPGGHSSRRSVYLLAGKTGLLFETGPSSQVPGILEALRSIGYPKERIAYIIPSHLHADHAGGAGSLARELPLAKVVAHEQGARHLVDPSRLIADTRQAFGEDFEDEFGPIEPVPKEQLMPVNGGERLYLGDKALSALGGLPEESRHCALLAAATLKEAIKDYLAFKNEPWKRAYRKR